ncbi:calpain-6 [Gracilinanus agilis]|uniref:calpain-6 n=1 Tax=Gracilinanus agilis TaxID=191870 RepID=UPI001CFDA04D|nr:calpain-6 [Gracilinanus agilis]
MLAVVKPFKGQKYHEIKQECLKQHRLFEDPEFLAGDESLFFSRRLPGPVEWKRPQDICANPHLFVGGISSHDLYQGKLGNCWFVAACSCLALQEGLWKKVIPEAKEQDWDSRKPEKYAGIFHFRFWHFGDWTDVVIDDRLPTINGELIFCHSNVPNEFWSALLEKAYAKLAGCYEALDGGNTADAITDFTGAVSESIDLRKGNYGKLLLEQTKLFEDLLKAHSRGALISCSISADLANERLATTEQGLVKGHAYSVTAVRKLRLGEQLLGFFKAEKLFMIRMRNPWGRREWNGPWSDSSEEWQRVSEEEKDNLGLSVTDDGEFWMAFDDWCNNFTDVDICRNLNTSIFSIRKTWEKATVRGAWLHDDDPLANRAGGCFNNRATFLQNPQYVFNVNKEEDKVLISLQQRDQRPYRKDGRGDNFIIGFEIFKVELNREYRLHQLHTQERVAGSTYIDSRTVFLRTVLKRGRYIIIPTLFRPGDISEFLLRLFTDVPSELRELTLDKPEAGCASFLCGYPRRITQINIHSLEGLNRENSARRASLYLLIKCGRERVHCRVQKESFGAVFDAQAIFYRKNPKQPILVQVWNRSLLCDQFVGQVTLPGEPSDSRELRTLQLREKGGPDAPPANGHLSLRVASTDDFMEL